MSKKILVVDDTRAIREALGKVLAAEGYEVFLAADGREAIAQFNAELMDLLILDVNLPNISGWEVFGAVTRINPFLPVIIITGEESQRNLAARGGIGALLEKPLNVPRLLDTIRGLMGESPATHIQELARRGIEMRCEGSTAQGES